MIVIHMISRFFSMENPIFQAPEGQGGPVSPVAPVSTATLMATLPGASEGAWPAPPKATGPPGPSPASDVAVGMFFLLRGSRISKKNLKDLYIFWLWVDFVKNWLNSGFDVFFFGLRSWSFCNWRNKHGDLTSKIVVKPANVGTVWGYLTINVVDGWLWGYVFPKNVTVKWFKPTIFSSGC